MTNTYIRLSFEPVKPLLLVDAVQAFKLFLHTSSLPEPEAKRIFNELAAEYLQTQKPPVKDTKTLYDYLMLLQHNGPLRSICLITIMTFFCSLFLAVNLFLKTHPSYSFLGGGAFFIVILFLVFEYMNGN